MTGNGRDPAAALFDAVLAAPAESRRDLLDAARRTNPVLCAEVESLLRYHDESDPILGKPDGSSSAGTMLGRASGANGSADRETGAPTQIGPYEVLARIGRGGMGDVYRARQTSPAREVAIKVVRPELASPEMIVRLEREAEALGRLQHPGVAHVYHCGSAMDDAGRRRTYVAMELIDGRPLTTYVQEAQPSINQRLDLMARVCDAVDHAHRRGVIHRDIKPGNILMTRESPPAPKVLDFGLARLHEAGQADSPAPGDSGTTLQGQVIGTLAYMSPEQAGGSGGGASAIDTRSDVYSLGAVLFEMLTGRPPVDLSGMTLAQGLRAIATQPRILAGRPDRRLRGDIESVVSKALELDPGRRYASAAELGADLRRIVGGQPVLARPQTAVYQLRKLAARNLPVTLALLALGAALVVGAGVASWQAVRIGHERDRAEGQARRARETAAFLRRMMLSATPEMDGGKETTLRSLLDEAAAEFQRAPLHAGDDPLVAIETLTTIAAGYMTLSEFATSEALARRATDLAIEHGVASSEEGLRGRIVLATSLAAMLRHVDAVTIAELAVKDAELRLGVDHPIVVDGLRALASAHSASQITPGAVRALPVAQRAYEIAQRIFEPNDERSIQALESLARAERSVSSQSAARAEGLLRELVERRRATRGPEHYRTLEAVQVLGRYLQRADRAAECRELLEPLLPAVRRVLPPGHDLRAHFEANLGEAMLSLGESSQAAELLRSSLDPATASYGGDIDIALRRGYLIESLIRSGRHDEAEAESDLQRRIAAASGDSFFRIEVEYQRLVLELSRGRIEIASKLAESLKGTHMEPKAAKKMEEARKNAAE